MTADPRPFLHAPFAQCVLSELPHRHPDAGSLSATNTLLLRELPELEAEVGCPVRPVAPDRLDPALPAILIGPAAGNPALHTWREQHREPLPDVPFVAVDRRANRIVIDGDDSSAIGSAIQLLRTAIADRRDLVTAPLCETPRAMVDVVDREVRRTFPMLADRAPAWAAAVDRARDLIDNPDDLATLQRLMATLGDAHSWARDTTINGRLPYHLHDDGETVRFWSVPKQSAAWQLGVRAGDTVNAPDTTPWRARAGSVPRTRPWNIGYRAMQGRVGERVELAAVRRDGSTARWTELVPPLPWGSPVSIDCLDARTGYLRIRGWLTTPDWNDAFTSALLDLHPYDRLVVDLRGNIGGALIAAQDARSRFLAGTTQLGSIQFSTVTGAMDRPHPLVAEPPASGPVWTKPVRFLTDPMCYSATEDFLHGLQGLPHVQLAGQATGGGSGRPRTIQLRAHLVVTISTALTFDRTGRCIEGNGFAPDVPISPSLLDPDSNLERVTSGW